MKACEMCGGLTKNRRYCSRLCSDKSFGSRGNVTMRIKHANGPCTIEGCGCTAKSSRGLCKKHHYQAKKDGSLPPLRCPCGELPTRQGMGTPRCEACIKRRKKAASLRHLYGIDIGEYEELLAMQDGRCAICRSEDPGGGTHSEFFPVDHNHETGEVRGLLCNRCNPGVGYFNDDPALLRAAADYLERHVK